jgi:hypothetical protein
MKDLGILVADLSMEKVLEAALFRHKALGIRPITFDIKVHPQRDGGIRTTGSQLLSLQSRQYMYGLLVLDFEGSGSHQTDALSLENELDVRLNLLWQSNAKAIVIEPELDVWMWGADNVLQQILGWPSGVSLRDWLRTKEISFLPNGKPERPKEAIEKIMFELKKPRSSALYYKIASKISFRRCTDSAFLRLRNTLVKWFPVQA